ncbi:hypothetical protein C7534_101527 [Pseudomonas sp. OV226]|nr:hypothetical protein C7534_101527 [Pseudomonas sp. OV226]
MFGFVAQVQRAVASRLGLGLGLGLGLILDTY